MLLISILGALGLAGSVFALVKWGRLPSWGHKDVLAFLALLSTVGGAMMLTVLVSTWNDVFVRQADRLITELVRDSTVRNEVGTVLIAIIGAQSFNLKMALAGIIVVLLSLGLVISARTLKASGLGANLEFSTDSNGNPVMPVQVQNSSSEPVPTTTEAEPTLPENIPDEPRPS